MYKRRVSTRTLSRSVFSSTPILCRYAFHPFEKRGQFCLQPSKGSNLASLESASCRGDLTYGFPPWGAGGGAKFPNPWVRVSGRKRTSVNLSGFVKEISGIPDIVGVGGRSSAQPVYSCDASAGSLKLGGGGLWCRALWESECGGFRTRGGL